MASRVSFKYKRLTCKIIDLNWWLVFGYDSIAATRLTEGARASIARPDG